MSEVVVRVRANGPLVIEAPVKVIDHNGNSFPVNQEKPLVALCRCGHSANKPFCDGAHNREGFRADNTAPAAKPDAG